jgi:hypothetical protein
MVSLISRLSSRKLFRGALRWCLGLAATVTPALVAPDMAHATTPTPRWDALNEPGTQGFGSMLRVSPFNSNTVLTSGDQWGAQITTDGGVTWQPCLGMTGASANNPDENDFTFLSSTNVWAGSAAGPFLSTDGGHNWTIMRSGMPAPSGTTLTCPIEKVIQDPNTPATLYAVSGSHRQIYPSTAWGQVWKSTNSGTSWGTGPVGTVVSGSSINDVCFQKGSSTILFAATNNGLYRSSNSGVNWSIVSGTPAVACYCVAPDPSNANVIYAGFNNNNGIYKTSNATSSDTWSAINSGISTSNPNDLNAPLYTIAIAPTNTSVLYAGFWGGATYYSNNAGSTWTKIVWAGTNSPVSPPSGVPGNLGFQCLSPDPSNAAIIWGTGASNVWRSTNSGVAWSTLTNYATNGAYRGNGCSGLDGTMAAWNPYTPGQVWTTGFDSGKQLRSADYLWSWTTGDTFTGSKGPYNGSYGVAFSSDGTTYIGAGQFGDTASGYLNEPIIKYKAGTWSYLSYPAASNVGECMSIYTLPTNSAKIWAVYGSTGVYTTGRIYYSSNGGSTWADITPSGAHNVYNIAVDPLNTNFIYVGADNGVYQSNSGGDTFKTTAMTGSPSDTQLNYVFADPSTTGSLYAIQWKRSSTSIWHYNGAGTWTGLTYASWMKYAFALAVDPHNAARLAVITKTPSPTNDVDPCTGIYLSSDSGATWTQYNNLKLNSCGGIAFNPDNSSQLIASMDGGNLVLDWGTSTPAGGSAVNLPGTVQAASYDLGGNKVAYFTTTGTVSTASADGGTVITSLVATDWLKYQVNPSTTGIYTLDIRYSATDSNTVVHLEANGVNVTGPITLSSSAGYTDKVITNVVRLIAGSQYLKLYVEKSGAASIHSIALTTAGSGSMSGSTFGETANFSLTVLTGSPGDDWAHYATGGVWGNFDHKATGSSQISGVTPFGIGEQHGGFENAEFNVSWTDGTPTVSDTDGSIAYSNASYNSANGATGLKFTVPASTTPRTLKIFWGGSQVFFSLNAHLSDGSAADYNTGSIEGPPTGSVLKETDITYSAASAGQTVTITLSKIGNDSGVTTGSVNLTCAWLH